MSLAKRRSAIMLERDEKTAFLKSHLEKFLIVTRLAQAAASSHVNDSEQTVLLILSPLECTTQLESVASKNGFSFCNLNVATALWDKMYEILPDSALQTFENKFHESQAVKR